MLPLTFHKFIPAEATVYPKLYKIYKELKRQNEIIFEAEKERNALGLERDDLKGLRDVPRKANRKTGLTVKMRKLTS